MQKLSFSNIKEAAKSLASRNQQKISQTHKELHIYLKNYNYHAEADYDSIVIFLAFAKLCREMYSNQQKFCHLALAYSLLQHCKHYKSFYKLAATELQIDLKDFDQNNFENETQLLYKEKLQALKRPIE